ncbi:MAG: type IV secretory system conjugative DNA transfer family protein [Alphaproteobacteria bacterium]
MASSNQTTQPSSPSVSAQMVQAFLTPEVFGLVGLFGAVVLLQIFSNKKGVLTDGRFANFADIQQAKRLGKKQIAMANYNQACYKIGDLYIPDAQRSTAVVGGSGAGKTDSIIDPAIDSAIQQGWTGMVYDIKGTLMARHAAYAIANGYDVYCFAPGFPYSDSLNILDFMRSKLDGGMAEQAAKVFNENLKPVGTNPDGYFDPAKDAVLKALFMMAKGSVYPDLLQMWELLNLPNLVGRLSAGAEEGNLSPWVKAPASSIISVEDAAETVAGIKGSLSNLVNGFVDPTILPTILSSTIPLDLPGKQLIFFQVDEQREAATAPLVAMAIHMLTIRNLNATVKRDRPFFICLDEFTSLRLPGVESWINKMREYGLVLMLGYQSESQLKMRYSNDYAMSIVGSVGTPIIFSPGTANNDVAEKWSKACGEKEVKYKTKSRGGKSGTSRSEHLTKVPLISASSISRMKAGECIILNPGYNSRPYKLRIRRLKKDIKGRKKCVQLWEQQIRQNLIDRSAICRGFSVESDDFVDYLEQEISNRSVYADVMLPTSEEIKAVKYGTPSPRR